MKFFKRFFMAMLLIGVLSTSLILCACNRLDTSYTLAMTQYYLKDQNPYISDYFNDESKLNIAEKINSVEELKSFCEEKHLKVFDETDTSLKYDKVSKKLKEYDEEFFKNYSIVLIFRFKETTDNYVYDSVSIKDGVMTVNLVTANGNTTTDVTTQIRIFEISKTVAKKINQIQVHEELGDLDQKVGIQIYRCGLWVKPEIYNSSKILNSYEELINFENFDLREDLSPQDKEHLLTKLAKYDNDYFQNKSLVLVFRRIGDSRFSRVKSFEIKGESLDITLSLPIIYDGGVATVVLDYMYYFEIDKEQVSHVIKININQIEE